MVGGGLVEADTIRKLDFLFRSMLDLWERRPVWRPSNGTRDGPASSHHQIFKRPVNLFCNFWERRRPVILLERPRSA